jgi:hypothetical protein
VSDKPKVLCKWKSEAYASQRVELMAIVDDARFVCLKCGRAANRKKWLCKPEKIVSK